MQIRKQTGVLISVVLLAAILLLLLDPWSGLRKEGRRIVLQDRTKIDRIILSDSYDSTTLVRQEGNWFIDGTEPVNPVTVENLLYAAEKLQIGSIQTEQEEWERSMVKRVCFCNGERPALQYEVISTGAQFLVRPERSERLFGVSIPGYAGLDLDRVFSTHPNHYREHLLIDLLPSEIRHIEMERRGGQPFRFSMDDEGGITCLLPDSDSILAPDLLDDLSIRLLFSYFTDIRVEGRAGEVPGIPKSMCAEEQWMARLYVESRRGEKHTLNIFSIPVAGGEKNRMFHALVLHNDDPEPMVINYIYLDVLMRDLSCYFAFFSYH
ncbi:MAG: hypothetical protein ABFS10_06060 [Bacteroidota bacterium]